MPSGLSSYTQHPWEKLGMATMSTILELGHAGEQRQKVEFTGQPIKWNPWDQQETISKYKAEVIKEDSEEQHLLSTAPPQGFLHTHIQECTHEEGRGGSDKRKRDSEAWQTFWTSPILPTIQGTFLELGGGNQHSKQQCKCKPRVKPARTSSLLPWLPGYLLTAWHSLHG